MEFWGLSGMVAPIEHTTQQTFLIGPFPNQTLFIGQDVFYNISKNLHLHLMKFPPHGLLHIQIHQPFHISCMNVWAYATKGRIHVES